MASLYYEAKSFDDINIKVNRYEKDRLSHVEYCYKKRVLTDLKYNNDTINEYFDTECWWVGPGLSPRGDGYVDKPEERPIFVRASRYHIAEVVEEESGYHEAPVDDSLKRRFSLDDRNPCYPGYYSLKLPIPPSAAANVTSVNDVMDGTTWSTEEFVLPSLVLL